jgi:hypothetical protein
MGSEAVNESTVQRGEAPAWVESFLDRIREGFTITAACAHAKINRTTPYAHARRCEAFAAEWGALRDARDDRLEDELAYRLIDGYVERELDGDGNVKAQRHIFDNRTALAYLKARRPERWSERRIDQGDGQEGPKLEITFTSQPETPPDTTKESGNAVGQD